MNTTARTYTIRVDGHLDDHWSAWLGDLDLACHDDGTTTLTVEAADQAQLHGVFARLRDIGAVIIDVRTTGPPALRRAALDRPRHSERLTRRPATPDHEDPTWTYRQLG